MNWRSAAPATTSAPAITDSCIFGPQNGAAPSYTGAPSNIGCGPAGATDNAFAGNIQGWNPYNANAAFLTGVVFPGFRDPYVYGTHLGIEHQLPGNSVLKISWVGTFGHKLYRSEDINRVFGGRDSRVGSGPSSNGECSLFGPYRVNCLFGRIRTWENSVNSNYNGLQVVYDKRMSHGLEWHANYVWSHSLDGRSTWHSGATTANGAAEGFSMDQAIPGLDYGNSTFDVHHTFTNSFVWQMPWYQSQRDLRRPRPGWLVGEQHHHLARGLPLGALLQQLQLPQRNLRLQPGRCFQRPAEPTSGACNQPPMPAALLKVAPVT